MRSSIYILLYLLFQYEIRCFGEFKKIPKNLNSFSIDRSYKTLHDQLVKLYNTKNIKIRLVASKYKININYLFISLNLFQFTPNR